MAEQNSDSSTSESEISACSSNFDPLKALYSEKTKIPVQSAPLYENLSQYETALKQKDIIPVGHADLVRRREEEKKRQKLEMERELEEKNKRRFAKYQGLVPTTGRERKSRNLLTRMDNMLGPLQVLREYVEKRLRIKVVTRNDKGIRGFLHATLVAFDKQWNLALSDVVEVWSRKGEKKRKVPPGLGTPVPKGTAASISPVPKITETPMGQGVWECTRHVPQLLVRGEHVVLISVSDR